MHLEVFIQQSLKSKIDALFVNSHHIYHVLSDICYMAPEKYMKVCNREKEEAWL